MITLPKHVEVAGMGDATNQPIPSSDRTVAAVLMIMCRAIIVKVCFYFCCYDYVITLSNCIQDCRNENFCGNRGTCAVNESGIATCNCHKDFTGQNCQSTGVILILLLYTRRIINIFRLHKRLRTSWVLCY